MAQTAGKVEIFGASDRHIYSQLARHHQTSDATQFLGQGRCHQRQGTQIYEKNNINDELL